MNGNLPHGVTDATVDEMVGAEAADGWSVECGMWFVDCDFCFCEEKYRKRLQDLEGP